VYGIVEQADGAIDIDSEIGRGSTFQIFLPRTWDPEEGVGSKATPASPAAPGGETVLVVEDDAGVATLIANALEKGGYAVLQAIDGERALAVVRAHAGPIDLLLTDVVMPGMNGCELAGHVTLLRRETRVLYMSGYADDAILRQGIETATVHFIQKPFSIDALTVKMREALRPGPSTVSGR
jgi:CheY-like chemotaxis protein